MGLSVTHLLVVAVVVLLLFGGNRVAELGKGLGAGLRNFKKGLTEDELAPSPAAKRDAAEASK